MPRWGMKARAPVPPARRASPSRRALFLLPAIVAGSLFGGAAVPVHAAGDPQAASPHFERGARSYDLGRFDEAIASFERAYALDPAPILLFNIAQAYRRLGNTERALHYYRRYLESVPATAGDRADVERRVRELERERERAREPAAGGVRPEASAGGAVASSGRVAATPAAAAAAGGVSMNAPPADDPTAEAAVGPRRWRIGVEAGVAIPRFQGGGDLESPASFAARALAGYRFAPGRTTFEVGGAVSVIPITYRHAITMDHSRSVLIGGAGRLEVSHPLSRRISVAGELLAGIVWWAGLGEGNPFTEDGVAASGPVPMASARLAIGLQVHLLPARLFAYLQPALAFYKPLDDGLGRSISSVTTVDLPIGIGYVF
jgi:hypothetical protein